MNVCTKSWIDPWGDVCGCCVIEEKKKRSNDFISCQGVPDRRIGRGVYVKGGETTSVMYAIGKKAFVAKEEREQRRSLVGTAAKAQLSHLSSPCHGGIRVKSSQLPAGKRGPLCTRFD